MKLGVSRTSKTPKGNDRKTFGIIFFKRFLSLQKLLFPQWKHRNTVLFVVLLLTEILEQYVGYHVGLVSGQFYLVLGMKDLDGFFKALGKSLGLILAISLIKTIRVYLTKLLVVGWRSTMTKKLHRFYFKDFRYYQLNSFGTLDNADQRITADVNLFSTSYGYILAPVLISPFTIAYYSYDAFSRAGWYGPVGMFVFFLVSTVINKFLMSPVVNLSAEQEKKEGDFRYKHVTAKVNSEQIAFSGSPLVELYKSDLKLASLCDMQKSVYNRQFFLNLATNTFAYISSIASFIVIAIPIFSGAYDRLEDAELSQLISENAFVCISLIFEFTKLVQVSGVVCTMAGATHRVAELVDALSKMAHTTPTSQGNKLESIVLDASNLPSLDTSEVYVLNNVSYGPPGANTSLVKDLNLNITLKKNLLVMGPSGSGKSSLLRVLRDIWPIQKGQIVRNVEQSKTMFFPQKIYLTEGSIRDQVAYPLQASNLTFTEEENQRILDLIKELGLGSVLLRCNSNVDFDPEWNWYDALSPGEIQRLAFVRLFYHRPSLVFLDETTSAVSLDVEEKLFRMCEEMGITVVSVGHRESLKKYHVQLLTVGLPEGGWELSELDHDERRES